MIPTVRRSEGRGCGSGFAENLLPQRCGNSKIDGGCQNIEKHYGRPMDIEWAIDEDFTFPESVFIVQARPETVWSQRKKAALDWQKRPGTSY
jgi:hypothetical protein